MRRVGMRRRVRDAMESRLERRVNGPRSRRPHRRRRAGRRAKRWPYSLTARVAFQRGREWKVMSWGRAARAQARARRRRSQVTGGR
jgi:hypothetical protein